MESGFQPHVVSRAGALGVMQVTPATWEFVETVLLGERVPRTTAGNVKVGILFLRHLLREFRGDERLALAAYYQGAKAVRDRGLFPETRTYVEAVRSLKGRV
jgi:soluble lytic murein transglycosylase-like protein